MIAEAMATMKAGWPPGRPRNTGSGEPVLDEERSLASAAKAKRVRVKEEPMMKMKTKPPKLGRPLKNGAPRVLGAYLPEDLQNDVKQYARERSAALGVEVSFSDIVARAVRSYRPFREWRKARPGSA